MLHDRLHEMVAASGGQLKISFVTSKALTPREQMHFKGNEIQQLSMRKLSKKEILDLVDVKEGECAVCMCGPDGFTKHIKEQLKGVEKVMCW